MLYRLFSVLPAKRWILLGFLLFTAPFISNAQATINVRIMAANINGNSQTYEPFALRIFEGLKPDVVCIQEFNYNNNTASDFRSMVDIAFGTNFVYYREPYNANGDLPNGIISRYPIVASGSWVDNSVGNRGFAWAQIHLPGTNDLYAVSVHLLTSSSGARATEATQLKSLIQANFPANAWIVLAGDFNTDSRTEAAMTTFKTFLSDNPIPADNDGNSDTSGNRNHPHDYVLPSLSFTNVETASVFPSHSFPNGLVFDSQVYTPLSDVTPVQFLDTTNAQHMAVIKDFLATDSGSGPNPPSISIQPLDRTVPVGSNVLFSVTAAGAPPLNYQWYFNTNTLISGATASSLTISNAQLTNAGGYSVIITNTMGSATSSVAILTVTNAAPSITTQPQSQTAFVGGSVTFSVASTGTLPLGYQWFFNTNVLITGALTNSLTITNVQLTNAGGYSVVVTNFVGSATSLVATLTVNNVSTGTNLTLAAWDVSGQSGYGTSPLAPTTNASGLTVVGLTRGTGITTGGTAAGRAWGGNGLDSTTSSAAVTAGDYATFSISANAGFKVSFTSISKFDYRRSAGGPPNGLLQYQIGAGSFIDITNLSYSSTSTSGASLGAIDLSGIAALQSISPSNAVTFRIVNYGASSSGGNWYIYDVATNSASDFTVQGIINSISSSNPPPSPAVLVSLGIISGNQFQFTVTGTAGSNYIIQVSTNLSGTNWTSIFTNTSPFTFTNSADSPQGFYRAVALP